MRLRRRPTRPGRWRNIGGAFERLRSLAGFASPGVRRVAAMFVDSLIVLESFVIALLFRFDASVPREYWASFWPFAAFSVVVFVALLFQSGVYRNVLRYT
ncbi:MAG: hypothetical protein M3120_11295, partial [Pseudomonadota bacterium]|nr:hypothetical protein [Pseudomonadota bacterium]